MRYILDDNGYVEEIIFGGMIDCNNKSCTEYIGDIPSGYTSLIEWADNANIRAYKIENNNLTYDSDKDNDLITKWAIEKANNTPETKGNKVTSIDSTNTDEQYPSAKAVYNAIPEIQSIELAIDTNHVYSTDFNYSCFKIGKMVILNIHSIAFTSLLDTYVKFISGLPKPVSYKIFYLIGGNGAEGSVARCGLCEDGSIQTHWGSPSNYGDSANKQYEGIVVYESIE